MVVAVRVDVLRRIRGRNATLSRAVEVAVATDALGGRGAAGAGEHARVGCAVEAARAGADTAWDRGRGEGWKWLLEGDTGPVRVRGRAAGGMPGGRWMRKGGWLGTRDDDKLAATLCDEAREAHARVHGADLGGVEKGVELDPSVLDDAQASLGLVAGDFCAVCACLVLHDGLHDGLGKGR